MVQNGTYAIIKTGGKQYRIAEGDEIDVELLESETGSDLLFNEVLFVNSGSEVFVGQPHLSGWTVAGEIVTPTVGPKVVSMKYKRRKNQRRKFGHRQHYVRVKITRIAQ